MKRYPSGAGDHQIDTEGRVIPSTEVQRPQPTGRAMTTDAHEELYRLLLDAAVQCPLNVLAQEIDLREVPYG